MLSKISTIRDKNERRASMSEEPEDPPVQSQLEEEKKEHNPMLE